jgi:hypothetical protein
MPVEIERKLMKRARKKGLKKGSKSYGRYVYGTLNRIEKALKK